MQTEQPSPSNQWVAFFSQTGSEIVALSEKLGRWPNLIVTNQRPEHLRIIDPRIVQLPFLFVMTNKPTLEEYESLFSHLAPPEKLVVTLHGWLRVMPPEICDRYRIFNGHPGLITKYPELKGKDPQERSFKQYETAGAVLHKVTAGVDEGDVIDYEEFLQEGLDERAFYLTLRDKALYMWYKFLKVVLS